MEMQAPTLESMESDHRAWLAAHQRWQQDIDRWRSEHESAVDRLKKLQDLIRAHGDGLDAHALTLRKSEGAVAAHDREIAEYHAGTCEKSEALMVDAHRKQANAFGIQQNAHEQMSKHHEAVMAALAALEAAGIAPKW